jgi:hypothetical protein
MLQYEDISHVATGYGYTIPDSDRRCLYTSTLQRPGIVTGKAGVMAG